jgi:Rv0078B-related antitoxin
MFDLYEAAEAMMRQILRRWFPQESEDLIERRLRAWLRKDPNFSHTPFETDTAPV